MRLLLLSLVALLLAACQQERLSYDGKVIRAPHSGKAPADWEEVLAVYASDTPGAPALAGSYALKGGTLVFTPAFPPSPELTLRIVHRAKGEVETLTIPGRRTAATAPTSVVGLYPTTDRWPANQLKFYIEFSGSMTRGEAWKHIRLLDAAGDIVEQPFVEIDQELWDPKVTRLTVLFDPGRIKRGLTDTDPPLVPGRSYTLRIDPAWPDAHGRPLTAPFEKRFTVVEDVRSPVDPASWKVTPPRDRDDPLVIEFPRPLDHALASRTITVPEVEGDVLLAAHETRWVFKPRKPWKKGRYEIRVDGILEDLAGNRLHRLFDVDTSDPAQTKPPPKEARLSFSVD